MKLTEEMIEAIFEKWVKTEPNRNKLPESKFEHIAAQHAFKSAISLLMPIIEKLQESNDTYAQSPENGYLARQTKQEVEAMLKSLADGKRHGLGGEG